MKSNFYPQTLLAITLAGLSACTMQRDARQQQHRHDAAGAPASESGTSSGHMMQDMQAMCDQHRQMMAQSPDARMAQMDERMKGMTPEMRQKHMDMMQAHCQ